MVTPPPPHLSRDRYALLMLNPAGVIVGSSPEAEHLTGYSSAQLIGTHASLVFPDSNLETAGAALGQVESQGSGVRKDGSRFPFQAIVSAIRDGTGAPTGFALMLRGPAREDKTEREGAAFEPFRLLVESVKDYAIFMLDPSGRVSTWNTGAERIKRYSAQEIIGQHFSRFYPQEDVQAGKPAFELEVAARDGRFEDEGWRVRKDGSMFWANVVITALHDPSGRLMGFAKVTRDLTDRRRLEEERLNRAKAEEATRLRDEFLSIASHELRTPLTALALQVEGMRDHLKSVDQRLARRIERAARSTERLTDLVEMLLDVSRIASGQFVLKLEPFDLGQAVHEIVEPLREAAKQAGCEIWINVEDGVVGTWDRLRVEQVLANLIGNAIKYAAGAPIAISVARDGAAAVLQVRDRGPGIAAADQTRIFGRFERAASTRYYGGMGLGLYVTRQIAEAHGGAVSVENPAGGGACFTVRLPLAPPETSAGRIPAAGA